MTSESAVSTTRILRRGRLAKTARGIASGPPAFVIMGLVLGFTATRSLADNECGPAVTGGTIICNLDTVPLGYTDNIQYQVDGLTLIAEGLELTVWPQNRSAILVDSGNDFTRDLTLNATNLDIVTGDPDNPQFGNVGGTPGRFSDGLRVRQHGSGGISLNVTNSRIATHGYNASGIYAWQRVNRSDSDSPIEALAEGTLIETYGAFSHGVFARSETGIGNVRASAVESTIKTYGDGVRALIHSSADQDSTGSVTAFVDSSSITSENGHGIWARTFNAGDANVIVSGETRYTEVISTEEDGIRIHLDGSNPNSVAYGVHVHGNVYIEGKKAGIRTMSGAGDVGQIRIDEGATVLGGLIDTNGDATVVIAGTIDGNVLLGNGTDLLTIAGNANIDGVTLLDGGGNYSSADEMGDVLTFDGWGGTIDGDMVVNWSQVVLSGGADVGFGHALTVGVDEHNIAEAGMGLFVGAGSTLRAAGGLVLTGNLTNKGLVTMVDGLVGDVVTVSGNYTSNSTLAFDVDFAMATADTLVINGDVLAGSHANIVVNPVGGAGTGKAVRLITVEGDNNGDYTLVGGPIDSGVWSYSLRVGSNVDLVTGIDGSNPINTIGAVYESMPTMLLSGFASLPALDQRGGQRNWLLRGDDGVNGVWMRVHGDHARVTPRISDSAASMRSTTWGLQLGADFLAGETENGYWVLGIAGQYGRINADVSNARGNGRISGSGYGLGITATWHGDGGTYLDLQGQASWISANYSTEKHGILASNHRITAYALSAELGHRYTLAGGNRQHTLVPQAQLSWGRVTSGSFTDSLGNDVALGTATRTLGRIGLAYEYRPNGLIRGQRPNDEQIVYGIVNILHDFSSANRVTVAGTSLQSRGGRTWGEIGLGGSASVAPNATLYGQASYRQALGGRSSGNSSLHGTVGLRFAW